mgnify:FL=1|jgi:hypothetical protein
MRSDEELRRQAFALVNEIQQDAAKLAREQRELHDKIFKLQGMLSMM